MRSMKTSIMARRTGRPPDASGAEGRALHGLRGLVVIMAALAALAVILVGAATGSAAPSVSAGAGAAKPISALPVSTAPAVEQELLARYQPYFRFAEDDDCGPASYRPIDVTPIFDNDQVVLRGPWDGVNVVQIAPSVNQVAKGLPGYHLDFPGNALRPDHCVYYDLQTALMKKHPSTIYGRVVSDPGVPSRLAIQYWFYYIFNDWKNRHEGDWEMIQIEFPVSTPAEALRVSPDVAAYSQHAGARVLPWDDADLEIVDSTHPMVFPAAGSHASYTRAGMFIARGGRQGLGCDDARATEDVEHPELAVIPSDMGLALKEQPWLGFEGRWGELQPSVYNGPTGPTDKLQWAHPFEWSSLRGALRPAARVPSTGLSLTPATDAFCTMVSAGAGVTLFGIDRPTLLVFVLLLVLALLVFAASRTRWQPSNPLRLARRRRLGQIFTASGRMMRSRPLTFLGVGLVAIPVGIIAAVAQWGADAIGSAETTHLGTNILRNAWVLRRVDEHETPTAREALRHVLPRLPLLAIPLVALLVAQFIMEFSLLFAVVFAVLVIRIALAPVIVGVDDDPDARHPLLKSIRLTRRHTWRTTVVVLGVAGVALFIGPSIGVLAMILTGWSFTIVNLIGALIHTVTLSYAAIVMTYLYADLRARQAEAKPVNKSTELPADIDLNPAT